MGSEMCIRDSNTNLPSLSDKRVRKALAFSLDRELISDKVAQCGQIPAYSFTPPGSAGYEPDTQIPYDPILAKQLLSEAGYSDPSSFPKLEILFNTSEGHRKIALAVQQMWQENLGIEVELVNQDWKVYLNREMIGDFQVSRAGWIGDYEDPNTFLDLMRPNRGNNKTGWEDPNYDSIVEKANSTSDQTQRYELLKEAAGYTNDKLVMIQMVAIGMKGDNMNSGYGQSRHKNLMNNALKTYYTGFSLSDDSELYSAFERGFDGKVKITNINQVSIENPTVTPATINKQIEDHLSIKPEEFIDDNTNKRNPKWVTWNSQATQLNARKDVIELLNSDLDLGWGMGRSLLPSDTDSHFAWYATMEAFGGKKNYIKFLKEVEKKFSSSKYGEFKIEVGEAVSNYLEPIFSKYDSLSDKEIMSLMDTNLNVAKSSAKKTMEEVNSLLGI